MDRLAEVYAWLARIGLPRDGLLVGIGGGAVLDLAGLAAGTWHRGVDFLAVPTTLLAMVDASIGGKTAINAAGLKNPVGVFHPAVAIAAEPGFLNTLSRREWRNGMAELIKTAVIGSARLFHDVFRRRDLLASELGSGRRNHTVPGLLAAVPWPTWIGKAARIKGRIVGADFRERGLRHSLNLGHTLGHALEAYSLGSRHPLSHGEAVAIGMATATRLAVRRRLCSEREGGRILGLLESCGLPTSARPPTAAVLARLIAGDKKRLAGRVRWVIPAGIGRVLLDQEVEIPEIITALRPPR